MEANVLVAKWYYESGAVLIAILHLNSIGSRLTKTRVFWSDEKPHVFRRRRLLHAPRAVRRPSPVTLTNRVRAARELEGRKERLIAPPSALPA